MHRVTQNMVGDRGGNYTDPRKWTFWNAFWVASFWERTSRMAFQHVASQKYCHVKVILSPVLNIKYHTTKTCRSSVTKLTQVKNCHFSGKAIKEKWNLDTSNAGRAEIFWICMLVPQIDSTVHIWDQ